MSSIQSSILYSLVLAVIGYFAITLLEFTKHGDVLFAVGIALGGAFIAIISNSSSKEVSSSGETISSAADETNIDTKTIYVGNLPYRANESAIKELFENYGVVQSVRLLKDRQTGKRRGFGFVEMEDEGAAKAIQALNESEFQQRTLKVREAKDRPEKTQGDEFQAQA
jgi:RNA recognition motif-containing protein